MARRRLIEPEEETGGAYFEYEAPPKEFIRSGCTLLDDSIGGGWALGRISNVIGDRSTGKTLIAIEACANFSRQYPDGKIYYREAEAAFDREYARTLGMPLDRVDFLPDPLNPDKGVFNTVEDMYDDVTARLNELADIEQPALYIVDSLDALSDDDEDQQEDIRKGTYGAGKAKRMSQFFRKRVRKLERCRTHLMFISQIRDKINATMFQRKWTRSGGHALDFYASQIVVLAKKGSIEATRGGIKRTIGVDIRAKCEKNKITTPFREYEFSILFGYGIDDLSACVDWLASVKRLDLVTDRTGKNAADDLIKEINKLPDAEFFQRVEEIASTTQEFLVEVAQRFTPTRSKYG